MKAIVVLLIFLLTHCAWAQEKELPTSQAIGNEFIGIWEAIQEGDPPDKAKREEPSELVILKDADGRIIVFLAMRYSDRQIRFRYGIASLEKNGLVFTDQKGFPLRITVGRNADYGRFLGVKPNLAGAEGEIGNFRKVNIR